MNRTEIDNERKLSFSNEECVHVPKKLCAVRFNYRKVAQSGINIIYIPKDTGKYKLETLVLKIDNDTVFTFYTATRDNCPVYAFGTKLDEYKNIRRDDQSHVEAQHKRNSPLSQHIHYQISHDQDPDFFLEEVFSQMELKNHRVQLYNAVDFLLEKPSEPGLAFEDGSMALNGGATSFNDYGDYIEGPCNLYRRSHNNT